MTERIWQGVIAALFLLAALLGLAGTIRALREGQAVLAMIGGCATLTAGACGLVWSLLVWFLVDTCDWPRQMQP